MKIDSNLGNWRRSGFSLIELIVGVAVLALLTGLILSCVQKVRSVAARADCQNRLRQLALAAQSYHGGRGEFPSGCSFGKAPDSYPFMTWCTRLLPQLGEAALWEQAKRDYAAQLDFLKPPSHSALRLSLEYFRCPTEGRWTPGRPGLTSYLGSAGLNSTSRDGALFLNSAVRLTDVTDGTSTTLLIGERPPSADLVFGWWYAGWGQSKDGSLDSVLGVQELNVGSHWARNCPRGPYSFTTGSVADQCDVFHFWSLHHSGSNFAFCDGSVRFVKYSAATFPALATRAAGDSVDPSDY